MRVLPVIIFQPQGRPRPWGAEETIGRSISQPGNAHQMRFYAVLAIKKSWALRGRLLDTFEPGVRTVRSTKVHSAFSFNPRIKT